MALKFHGHLFSDSSDPVCNCCVRDAGVLSDPTKTGPQRKRLRSVMALRWRSLRVLIREVVVNKDVLGLKANGLTNMAAPMLVQGGTRIQLFKRWWDQAAATVILGTDGSVFRKTIDDTYDQGVKFAQEAVGKPVTPLGGAAHKEALLQWAVAELQGVQDAVGQKVLRAASLGILNRQRPMAIVREIWKAIDGPATIRTAALVETLVTKAFSDATLDTYEAAEVTSLGILPEAKRKIPVAIGDAAVKRKGAGSRVSRKKTPSASTIARITKQEELLQKKLGRGVYVRTAEDDDVCPICEKLADEGPYTIDQARALIPAHPNCRCAFIPAFDRRYKRVRRDEE